jgi:hypothetical protein
MSAVVVASNSSPVRRDDLDSDACCGSMSRALDFGGDVGVLVAGREALGPNQRAPSLRRLFSDETRAVGRSVMLTVTGDSVG